VIESTYRNIWTASIQVCLHEAKGKKATWLQQLAGFIALHVLIPARLGTHVSCFCSVRFVGPTAPRTSVSCAKPSDAISQHRLAGGPFKLEITITMYVIPVSVCRLPGHCRCRGNSSRQHLAAAVVKQQQSKWGEQKPCAQGASFPCYYAFCCAFAQLKLVEEGHGRCVHNLQCSWSA
jgi:hypothetical protein